MQKMCDKMGLRFVRCAVNEKGNDEPTSAQIKKAIEEEHRAIIFLYKTNMSQYGKLLKQSQTGNIKELDTTGQPVHSG